MGSFTTDWGEAHLRDPATDTSPGVTSNTAPANQGFNNLFDLFQTVNAPQQQAITNQVGALNGQMNTLLAGYNQQSGLMNQSQANQMAGYGLQDQLLGIQRGALGRQQNLLPQQQDIANQQLDISGNRIGLQRQQLALQRGQIIPDYIRNLNSFLGGQAARGAVTTGGTASGMGQLEQNKTNALANADIQSQGLDLSDKSLGLERRSSQLSYDERRAALDDANKQLDISSQQSGIAKSELQNRTQQALSQLGLQTQLSVNDVFKAISDAEAGRFNPIQSFLGTIYQLTGIRPTSDPNYGSQIGSPTGSP